jgi:prepilin peptidase CpaA
MVAHTLVLFVLPALLAASAGWDLASYTIPNFLPGALAAVFVLFALVSGMAPSAIGIHALAGLAGLAIGVALFAFGLIGGGDAKLFAVIVLWLGFGKDPTYGTLYLFEYVLMTAVFGGVLAIFLITLRSLPLPSALYGHAWLARLLDPRAGIPYGVALAGGMLVLPLLPHTEIFSLVAA